MLTRKIQVQVAIFTIIALLGVAYVGARYARLGSLFYSSGYDVTLELPQTGGLFENSEVTYRGVPVGRVDKLTLSGTGVTVDLHINPESPDIPEDLAVSVSNRSAIGEQYVDLRPNTDSGPYLADGSVITGNDQDLPPTVESLLTNTENFTSSIPIKDLRTVVDELYDLSDNSSGNLRRLISTSNDVAKTADENWQTSSDLIDSSAIVLGTQNESASSIKEFSRNLRLLNETVKASDGDLRNLITSTPAAATEIDLLFQQVGAPLGVLMSNLLVTAQVFAVNTPGIEDTLTNLPDAVDIGYAVTRNNELNLGLVTDFFDPLPCTSGYGGTTVRPGLDTSPGDPLNLKAGCTAKGTNYRGPGGISGSGGGGGGGGGGGPEYPPDSRTVVTVPDSLADLMGGTE